MDNNPLWPMPVVSSLVVVYTYTLHTASYAWPLNIHPSVTQCAPILTDYAKTIANSEEVLMIRST